MIRRLLELLRSWMVQVQLRCGPVGRSKRRLARAISEFTLYEIRTERLLAATIRNRMRREERAQDLRTRIAALEATTPQQPETGILFAEDLHSELGNCKARLRREVAEIERMREQEAQFGKELKHYKGNLRRLIELQDDLEFELDLKGTQAAALQQLTKHSSQGARQRAQAAFQEAADTVQQLDTAVAISTERALAILNPSHDGTKRLPSASHSRTQQVSGELEHVMLLEQQVAQRQGGLEAAQEALRADQEALAQAQEALQQREQALDAMEAQLTNPEAHLQIARDYIERAQDSQVRKRELKQLRKELETIDESTRALLNAIEEEEARKEELQATHEELKNQEANLQKDIEERRAEVEASKQAIKQLNKDLKSAARGATASKEDQQRIEAECAAKQEEHSRLKSELTEARARLAALDQERLNPKLKGRVQALLLELPAGLH